MRIGQIVALPNDYSRFGRIVDEKGIGYTVDASELPEDAKEGDEFAYRVELWSGGSGLAYDLEED